jgi:glucosylceramidase
MTVETIEICAMDEIVDGPSTGVDLTDGATYKIKSAHSGKVLEVESGSTSDGANVQQWEYNGGDHQK